MESKRNQPGPDIAHWSAPWSAGWSGMASEPEMRTQAPVLPKDSERRIKRVGLVASSVAVVIWCAGIAWLWPIVA